MTPATPSTATSVQSRWLFRLTILLGATFLGTLCVWLVSAELLRPGIIREPMNEMAAAEAAKHSEMADRAAAIGAFRGDLWAEAAFTHAQALWGGAASGTSVGESVQRAREELGRAVRYAPHRSDAWLLIADLAQRFASMGFDPTEALRMSYYTGSSEMRLVPLRLMIAVKRDGFDDPELRELIRHDIRLLLGQKQIAPISGAYEQASVKGKDFLMQTVRDIDPSVVDTVQGGTKRKKDPVAN